MHNSRAACPIHAALFLNITLDIAGIGNHFRAKDNYEFGKYTYQVMDQSKFDNMWNETAFDYIDSWKW